VLSPPSGAITVTCLQPSFILHVSLLHGLCVGPVLLDAAENSAAKNCVSVLRHRAQKIPS
jgi:hypothetical protein